MRVLSRRSETENDEGIREFLSWTDKLDVSDHGEASARRSYHSRDMPTPHADKAYGAQLQKV